MTTQYSVPDPDGVEEYRIREDGRGGTLVALGKVTLVADGNWTWTVAVSRQHNVIGLYLL